MLCCKFIKSQRNLKLKVRTVFQNVWGEYKYHGNPYIQGTTVPCDYIYMYMYMYIAIIKVGNLCVIIIIVITLADKYTHVTIYKTTFLRDKFIAK